MESKELRYILPEDYFEIKLAGDPQISKDGKEIAFVAQRMDRKANKYFSNIWLISVDEKKYFQFTYGDFRDRSPRWSPDGKEIAFLSNRTGNVQIYVIPRFGGEARPVSKMEEGSISNISWSPDGTKILFIYHKKATFKDDGLGWKDELADKDKKPDPSAPPRVRVIKKLHYRGDNQGYYDDEYDHIWILDVKTGEAKLLVGDNYDAISPTWSPDGKYIAFFSNRTGDADYEPIRSDLWIASVEDGSIRKVVDHFGATLPPVWSPDGKYIAFIGNEDLEHSYAHNNPRVMKVEVETGNLTNLTANFDRPAEVLTVSDAKPTGATVSPPAWSFDGKKIYFLVGSEGTSNIYVVSSDKGGDVTPLTKEHLVMIDFTFSQEAKRFAIMLSTDTIPTDIFSLTLGENGEIKEELTRLTDINKELFSQIKLGEVEDYWFNSYDGKRIHGFLMKPPSFDPSKKYPLIVQIHGGPSLQNGHNFFHEYHCLAAEGYLVTYINFRGSHCYGEEFCKEIWGDWGHKDYEDIMAGVDYLITLPYVDKDRLGVTGGSFGGYMTNWIVGHTDRFKVAVSHRSLSNVMSMEGTADCGPENIRTFKYHAWDNPEYLLKMSPLMYVKNVVTPILIFQSENDFRCPIEQAEQFYTAIKLLRKAPVEFIRFPEESHELSRSGRPDRRMERLYRILNWFRKYLKE